MTPSSISPPTADERVARAFGNGPARVAWIAAEQSLLEEYVDGYEMCCDDYYYTPTERERELLRDALQGFVLEHDELLSKHLTTLSNTVAPAPVSEVERAVAALHPAWFASDYNYRQAQKAVRKSLSDTSCIEGPEASSPASGSDRPAIRNLIDKDAGSILLEEEKNG